MSKAFIGLGVLLILTFWHLWMCKKISIPVMVANHVFFSILCYIFFGWITIICSVCLAGLLGFMKYKKKMSDEAEFDYSDTIHTFSRMKNRLQKAKGMVVGTILPVNHNELKYNWKKLELDDVILSGGSMITGSTGSGKTSTMKTILKQRINEKRPVVFFDYKGEEEILDDIQKYAKDAGVPYYEFSARACTFTYDPFKNLNETGKVEALMNTRRWSMDGADEHYKTSMQLAIQNLVRSYDEYREKNGETVNYIVGLYNYSKGYTPQMNEKDGYNNLIKSLEILLSSRAKDLFGDSPDFTFEDDRSYVICFSFTSANKALASNISSFVYTDLMDRGTRMAYPKKLLLCIDEFGTLESSIIIKDLLEKGRSGGIQTVFSILDINQIAMNSGEFFVQALLGTINNYIIHAGATQNTADLLAGVQKYNKGYDIMSLRKPYKGKKPTALFISKYPIITKRNNQEVYRIIPYAQVLSGLPSTKQLNTHQVHVVEQLPPEPVEETLPDVESLDLTQPIKDVEKYL